MSIEIIRLQVGELNTLRVHLPDGRTLELPVDGAQVHILRMIDNELTKYQGNTLLKFLEALRAMQDANFELGIELEIPVPSRAGNTA